MCWIKKATDSKFYFHYTLEVLPTKKPPLSEVALIMSKLEVL